MDDEIAGASWKWTYSFIGKLLGKGLSIEFLTRELKAQWAMARDFNVVPLSKRVTWFSDSTKRRAGFGLWQTGLGRSLVRYLL